MLKNKINKTHKLQQPVQELLLLVLSNPTRKGESSKIGSVDPSLCHAVENV